MAYNHGVRIQETETSIVAPIVGTAGLQVVFGTAPVNLAEDPYHVTNVPIIVNNWNEAVSKLGYSAETDEDGHFLYTLCESMYASFKLVNVAPVVFVNVLDPKKHHKANAASTIQVINREAVIPTKGILPDTIKVRLDADTTGAVFDVEQIRPSDQNTELWEKTASELQADNMQILADGSVVGALKYVTYQESSGLDEEVRSGNFFMFHVPKETGIVRVTTDADHSMGPMDNDQTKRQDISIRVESNDMTVKVEYSENKKDFTEITTLNFRGTVLQSEFENFDLSEGSDYIRSFDDQGRLVLTFTGEHVPGYINIQSDSIDPTMVNKADIIGATSGNTEQGLEVIRQIYPKLGMTPGLIVVPGFSHMPEVAAVIAAKCEEINGYFTCEAIVDINSNSEGGTATYDAVKAGKESAGMVSKHLMACWPCVVSGEMKFWYSSVMAALTAYTDANNDDVPNLSPSNKMFSITGTVLSDAKYTYNEQTDTGSWDKEINLDQLQANIVNSFGVTTAINVNGWRTWGNNTVAYPASTDPKDRWFCCRRFFSWWGNSFILTYFQKVDSPMNRRLIESIIDAENIRGNAYVATGKCAAVRVEYLEEENPVTDIINGKMTFHIYLSPYVPAEDILGILEFDVNALQAALTGG